MSYDIWLETDDDHPSHYGLDFNYTTNCAPMWRHAGIDLRAVCACRWSLDDPPRPLSANEAGIRDCRGYPEDSALCRRWNAPIHFDPKVRAADLIEPLYAAITRMRADPDTYRAMNPENGWGNYEGALEFLEEILAACKRLPNAIVRNWH